MSVRGAFLRGPTAWLISSHFRALCYLLGHRDGDVVNSISCRRPRAFQQVEAVLSWGLIARVSVLQALAGIRQQMVQRVDAAVQRLRILATGSRWRAKQRALLKKLSLMPDKPVSRRKQADWKRLRKSTLKAARQYLNAGQLSQAIDLLILALLEDPLHRPYCELLKQAIDHKRSRKTGRPRKDLEYWGSISDELRDASSQLEVFIAYSDKINQLFSDSFMKRMAPR